MQVFVICFSVKLKPLRQSVSIAPAEIVSSLYSFSIKLMYLLILKPCERKHSSEFTQYNYKNILSWVHVSFIYVSLTYASRRAQHSNGQKGYRTYHLNVSYSLLH